MTNKPLSEEIMKAIDVSYKRGRIDERQSIRERMLNMHDINAWREEFYTKVQLHGDALSSDIMLHHFIDYLRDRLFVSGEGEK